MMQLINAISIAPDARDWLANSRHPRILHVFDHACNLINERREVLSIVTPQIGNGPFNLVIEDEILFSDHLKVESPISILDNQIAFGDLTINAFNVQLWNPCPDWEKLHAKRGDITNLLLTNDQTPGLDTPFATNAQGYSTTTSLLSLLSNLSSTLANADITTAKSLTTQLAGLGQGLTPAGDDFLMGAMYAAWVIHPQEIAKKITEEIANIATPLTTSLSCAWLKSAAKGEAGEPWHELFDALLEDKNIYVPMSNILSVGETSGSDALAGFVGATTAWGKNQSPVSSL